jgi:hypothetical protein
MPAKRSGDIAACKRGQSRDEIAPVERKTGLFTLEMDNFLRDLPEFRFNCRAHRFALALPRRNGNGPNREDIKTPLVHAVGA